MIDKKFIDSAREIRKKYKSLYDELEMSERELKQLANFLIEKSEEFKHINENIVKKAKTKEDSNTKNEVTKNETGIVAVEEMEEETVLIDLQLSNLMMHYLAIRRRDLFTRYPDWIPDLVLLIDCPDRYPKKFQTQQPQFSQS
jgi:septal ring factor EnvC (AmiA/AmiB activator)